MSKEMPCIVCPMSCRLQVELDEQNHIVSVCGNTCKRGENYAREEWTNPMRMLTSTVKIELASCKRLPVILSASIPKGNMMDVMKELETVTVKAPITIYDIIVENVCNLSVNVIASRSMEQVEE